LNRAGLSGKYWRRAPWLACLASARLNVAFAPSPSLGLHQTVVFASAGVGTVFAATTATTMVVKFGVEALVFTGVAGGLRPGQKVREKQRFSMESVAACRFPSAAAYSSVA